MDKLSEIIQPIMNSVVIIFIYFCFLNKMYDKKCHNKYLFLVGYLVSVVVSVLTIELNFPLINVLRSLIVINALCFVFYKAEVKSAIVFNTVFIIATVCTDIIAVALLAAIEKESLVQILGNFEVMLISNLLYWICTFFVYKLLIHLFSKDKGGKIQTKETVCLFLATAFEVSIILFFITFTKDSAQGVFLIFVLLGFLILNIYFTRLIHNAAEVAELRGLLALSNQQSAIQLKHYQELVSKEDLSRKLAHDIKKHMQVMNDLYVTGKLEQANEYKTLLNEKIDSITNEFRCSSLILSVIINHQLEKAKLNEIDLWLKIDDVPIDFMNDLDITAIFANLLDNAIDACLELDKDQRTITMDMRRVKSYMVLDIYNPINKTIEKVGEIYKTSKENHSGIGLTNVLNAVEKYNGGFSVDVEDGLFVARVAIPLPKTQ